MSGIFGLIDLAGGPVQRKLLQTMRDAIAYWGPDGSELWHDGAGGLGHLHLYNTPESVYEQLPRWYPEYRLAITAEARIDNRDELCDFFKISPSERLQTPDSYLILHAYLKWGEACPDHLLGDWSFAIWHPDERRLFLARDHHGNTSVYYSLDKDRFAFASSRKALIALGVPRRLNELYLGQMLVSWPAYHGEQTVDLDILRLPPACAMRVTPERSQVWRYWYLEDAPDIHFPKFSDYVEGFVDVYDKAIRCRLRTKRPLGITLSGGLDSGSLAALAARAYSEKGDRLPAFTSVPIYNVSETVGSKRFGDESALAVETADYCGNIDLHFIPANQSSPIAGIRQMLSILDEPSHAASNFYWIYDLLQTARHQGIGTILTGQGGNSTVSWTGRPEMRSIYSMLRRRGWRESIKQLLPISLLRILMFARSHRHKWQGSAINPSFARSLDLAKRQVRAVGVDQNLWVAGKSVRDIRHSVIKPGRSIIGAIWSEIGAAFQIEVRDPTFDKRILAYTIGVPDQFFTGENGQDRWLIRSAMAGLLPDSVRLNKLRGRQAADLVERLRMSPDQVEDALAQLADSLAERYLNLERMSEVWSNTQQMIDPHTTHQAGNILLRGIGAGLFLN